MNHTTEEPKAAAKRTGRRYASVMDLLKEEAFTPEVRKQHDEIASQTRVTEKLALMRQYSGITQAEMGKRLGVTQATISKLEAGRDEDLTIRFIREYSKAADQRIGLMFGRPMNHVEAVKAHALAIQHRLSRLAGLAHQGEELEKEISGFFGQAFFNLLSILSRCSGEMPNGPEFEVRFEGFEPKKLPAKQPRKRQLAQAEADLVSA